MLHCQWNCRWLLLQKYKIIDVSLQDQVNIKWSAYSNTCYVAYLHELTDFLFLHPCDEAAGPQKSGILLFAT
jgi:hypothetical protein